MGILESQDKKLKFTGIAVGNEELWAAERDGGDNDQPLELDRESQNEQENRLDRSHETGSATEQ